MSEYTPPSGPNAPYPGRSVPPMSQPPMASIPSNVSGKKIAAGICGILLGSLGIHKFILGYTGTGIIMLILGFITCGLMGIVGIIEGIIYLTKTDEEFYNTYMVNERNWF